LKKNNTSNSLFQKELNSEIMKNENDTIYLNSWAFLNSDNTVIPHNFGDDINFSFLKELTGKQHKKYNKKDKKINYIFIGSILCDEYIDDFTKIWGSGFLYKHNLKNKPNKIYAVRGPKTRDYL